MAGSKSENEVRKIDRIWSYLVSYQKIIAVRRVEESGGNFSITDFDHSYVRIKKFLKQKFLSSRFLGYVLTSNSVRINRDYCKENLSNYIPDLWIYKQSFDNLVYCERTA